MVDWEGEGKVMPDFAKLENQQRQGAQQEGDLPDWAARQQKVFTNWINNKASYAVRTSFGLLISCFSLRQDGTVLYGLLEVLSKQSLGVLGKVKPETNKIKKIANMNIVWKYLSNTVKLVGIGPTDIVDGNVTLTLGMIWSLIVFFMAKDLGDAGDGLGVLKKRIMEWMTRRTREFPDVNVSNFTTSLADGRALLAILNDCNPAESPYDPTDNPAKNLRRAFEEFQRLYGVGSILDPDDPQCCADEKANITYLAELMKAMPDDGCGDGEGAGRVTNSDRIPVVAAVPSQQAAIRRAGDLFPGAVDRLKDLCSFGPEEGQACAQRVSEMMAAAGLADVKVIKPSQDREDASMRGDSLVVGEKPGPPGTPTVLFYASYATVDESLTGVPLVCPGRVWTVCRRRISLSPSRGTLSTEGAAHDKANVACQLAAVEALLKGALPCGVRVVVGATPPPGSMSGNASLEVADRLADFLRAHPSVAGLPDLVVVSEPAGSTLAPEKNAVLVGCRGFACLRVTSSRGRRRSCAEFGGPLIDPARVLANVLASLHDPATGGLRVEGLSPSAGALSPELGALAEGLRGLRYGEGEVRADAGYSPPPVECAKEIQRGPRSLGANHPTRSTTRSSIFSSVAEQLAILPAVTVTSLSTTPSTVSSGVDGDGVTLGAGGGLLGSRFPATASAGIHLCLPPGAEYASAVEAFQAHCTKHAPHGVKVKIDKVVGRAGWLAPPGSPIVSGVMASLNDDDGSDDECEEGTEASAPGGDADGAEPRRETVMASNPGFSAIPSAFARALPGSTVIGLGVNDPESKGGKVNESVLVDDLKGFVQSAVRLMHGVAAATKKKEGGGPERTGTGAGEDAPTAYSHRFMDDLDRRNKVNQLRGGKLSIVSSPAGSATTSPRGYSNGRGVTAHGAAGGSPVRPQSPSRFSTLERTLERENLTNIPSLRIAQSRGARSRSERERAYRCDRGIIRGARVRGWFAEANPNLLLVSVLPRASPVGSHALFVRSASLLIFVGFVPNHDDDDDKVGGGTPETVLAEINELRTDPKAYAEKLEGLREFYDKSMYQSPTGPPVQTTEGVKPLLEVIAMLKTTEALEPFETKEGMQQAAADHVKDLAQTSRTGHSGSDGSGAADRMNRYGHWLFLCVAGEVCTYFDATAEGIVAQLLVSDGERSRHNRKALLAAHFKVCGIALGTHPTVGAACVITLAGGYGPRPLARSADVVCQAGETPTAEFREVLESIPVPQITDEVRKCLKAGMEVQMKYTPGSIKCTFVQSTGARKSMGCTWA
ncbi:unnamed protein product [Scytosiphon promiscuus]